MPLKNPEAPDFFISSTGFVKTPVTPLNSPFPRLIAPLPSPVKIFFAFFYFAIFLYLIYSESIAREVSPEATELLILATALKAPAVVFWTREPEPCAIPYIPYKGPFTNPSIGLLKKSTTPFPTLLKRETGFPIISRLPTILARFFIIPFLQCAISMLVNPIWDSKTFSRPSPRTLRGV